MRCQSYKNCRRYARIAYLWYLVGKRLGACSNLKVNTDCLSNSWIQISPAGSYEDVIPFWNFTKDGYLYIQEGGYGKGSCIPDGISSAGLSPATEIVKLERHHYLL